VIDDLSGFQITYKGQNPTVFKITLSHEALKQVAEMATSASVSGLALGLSLTPSGVALVVAAACVMVGELDGGVFTYL
jgi:hypothetical protein